MIGARFRFEKAGARRPFVAALSAYRRVSRFATFPTFAPPRGGRGKNLRAKGRRTARGVTPIFFIPGGRFFIAWRA